MLNSSLPLAIFAVLLATISLQSHGAGNEPTPKTLQLQKIGGFEHKTPDNKPALERVGGIMVYDVTQPSAPSFVTYLNTRTGDKGDNGPEGLHLIPAKDSPNGKPLLIVANETSGTTAVIRINLGF